MGYFWGIISYVRSFDTNVLYMCKYLYFSLGGALLLRMDQEEHLGVAGLHRGQSRRGRRQEGGLRRQRPLAGLCPHPQQEQGQQALLHCRSP